MNKAQYWVLGALTLAILIQIAANPAAYSLLKQGHPVQATQTVDFNLVVYWIVGVIVLLVIADPLPVVSGWIAGLILAGAVLQKGQAAISQVQQQMQKGAQT